MKAQCLKCLLASRGKYIVSLTLRKPFSLCTHCKIYRRRVGQGSPCPFLISRDTGFAHNKNEHYHQYYCKSFPSLNSELTQLHRIHSFSRYLLNRGGLFYEAVGSIRTRFWWACTTFKSVEIHATKESNLIWAEKYAVMSNN